MSDDLKFAIGCALVVLLALAGAHGLASYLACSGVC